MGMYFFTNMPYLSNVMIREKYLSYYILIALKLRKVSFLITKYIKNDIILQAEV